MESDRQETVTRLLQAVRTGRAEAVDDLIPLVYDELHVLARRHRRKWHGDFTLNTTGLLHEAYLKLVNHDEALESRSHFMAVASKAMRQLLVDQARRRNSQKRGGEVQKLSLENMQQEPGGWFVVSDEKAGELMALDAAIERLARHNERQAQVVECRFFGGLTIEETAAALGVSPATVKLDWAQARRWLFNEMSG